MHIFKFGQRVFAGLKLAPGIGGKPISERTIQSKHMLPGYFFLDRLMPRAWIWIHKDIEDINDSSGFFKLKLSHFYLNKTKLKRAMEKRIEKLNKKLFDRDIGIGIEPWD